MLAQARGLAKRVDPAARDVIVHLRGLYALLPPGTPGLLRFGLGARGARLAPPWPDLVISCGRRAARVALAVRDASGGRSKLVHVQDPLCDPSKFDLVIAMEHDDVDGPNVMKVLTALHEITREELSLAEDRWRPLFGALPSPRIGVLLGGPTRHGGLTPSHVAALARDLATLRERIGASLLITPSRRTPAEAIAHFRAVLGSGDDVWIWDGSGDNPYRGILALSDRLIVTGDSVSMISEAIASGRPVEIFAPASRARHRRFITLLEQASLAREFTLEGRPPVHAEFDETDRAAAAVRALLSSAPAASEMPAARASATPT